MDDPVPRAVSPPRTHFRNTAFEAPARSTAHVMYVHGSDAANQSLGRASDRSTSATHNISMSGTDVSATAMILQTSHRQHEELLMQSQQQVRDLLPYKEQALHYKAEYAAAADRLRGHDDELRSARELLLKERQEKEARVERLEALLTEAQALKNDKAERLLEQLRFEEQEARRRSDELAAARDALKRNEAEAEKARKSANTFELENDALRRGLRDAEQRADAASGELKRREDAHRAMKTSFDEMERNHRAMLDDADRLKRRLHELQLENTQLVSAKNTLLEKVQTLSADADALPAIKRRAAEVDTLREELQTATQASQEHEYQARNERNCRRSVEAERDQLQARVRTLEQQLHDTESRLATADARGKQLDETREQLTVARQTIGQVQRELAASQEHASAAEREGRSVLASIRRDAGGALRSALDSGALGSPERRAVMSLSRDASPEESAIRGGNNTTTATPATAGGASQRSHSPIQSPARQHHPSYSALRNVDAAATLMDPVRLVVSNLCSALEEERARANGMHRSLQEAHYRNDDVEEAARVARQNAAHNELELAKMEQARTRLAEAVGSLTGELREAKSELDARRAFLAQLVAPAGNHDRSASPQDANTSSNNGIGALDWDEVERAVVQIVERQRSLQHDRRRLEAELTSLTDDYARAKATWVTEGRANTERHDAEVADMQRTIAHLKAAVTSTAMRHETAMADALRLQGEVDSLSARIADRDGDIAALRREVDEERASHVATGDSLRATTARYEELRGEHGATCDALAVATTHGRAAEQARDQLYVLLGCVVPSVRRLRCDLQELLMQRRVLTTVASEQAQALLTMQHVVQAFNEDGFDDAAPRHALHKDKPATTLRVAAIAVLVAVRLQRLIPPGGDYSRTQPRHRYRAVEPGRRAVASTVHANVSLPATAVPLPPIQDVLQSIAVSDATACDWVVEQLLVCFSDASTLSVPAPDASPSRTALSPHRCAPHPSLLRQLRGCDLDLTLLRRLGTGLYASSIVPDTPLYQVKHWSARLRDVQRRLAHTASTASQQLAAASAELVEARRSCREAEERAASYSRQLADSVAGAKTHLTRSTVTNASRAHDAGLEEKRLAAERKRVDAALAQLHRKEAALAQERLALDSHAAYTRAAQSSSRASHTTSHSTGVVEMAGGKEVKVRAASVPRFASPTVASAARVEEQRRPAASGSQSATSTPGNRSLETQPPLPAPEHYDRRSRRINDSTGLNVSAASPIGRNTSGAAHDGGARDFAEVMAIIGSLDSRVDTALRHHSRHSPA